VNDERRPARRPPPQPSTAPHDTTGRGDRHALLERFGRCYGANYLAVAFTQAIVGDPEAKRCLTRGWQTTTPLAGADFGAALVANRGRGRNPVIVLRPSRLIGLECDSWQDLDRITQLRLPTTATVCSSQPFKRHFYFRPSPELESLPFVAFRFENGKVTADETRYFVAPPSLHPTGVQYAFLPGLGIDEIGFAELPAATYRYLIHHARGSDTQTRSQLQEDPAAKVTEGRRRDMIFRYSCALRRWSADRGEIMQAALEWNRRHCEPPLEPGQVAAQVDGAMRKPGSQAFR
jgi:hypothetical protein